MIKARTIPITPRLLIKALKELRRQSFKSLFFTPREVANKILETYINTEPDYELFVLEVSDKLACAAGAGLIGTKQGIGYFAYDMRQKSVRSESRSELMFWLFYKRILKKRMAEEKKKSESEEEEEID